LSIIFANSRKHSEIVGVSRDHRLLIRRDDHYNGGSDGGSDLAIPQIVLGGAGKDHISGGPCNDVLIGGHGKDKLSGGKGADILIGGDHKDKLKGGTGDDLLIGGLSGLADDDVAGSIAASTAWLSGILTDTLLALGGTHR
jgi:Ca2+-binding RTX toxin-like protein